MVKRILTIILSTFLIFTIGHSEGFISDIDAINEAAKSVLMLEVFNKDGEPFARGSGFVIHNNETLVTNYHVIENAAYILGYSDDGYTYVLNKIYLADERVDLALLGFSSPTNLTPLLLNHKEIRRGEPVVAIGSPKGFLNTVSIGNISAFFEQDNISYIQFTAPISNGSSGGAVFNDQGCVIGVSTMTYDDGDNAQNLNFAINASEISELADNFDLSKAVLLENYFYGETQYETTAKPLATATPKPTAMPTHSPLPTGTPRKYRLLKKGDQGDEVKTLQTYLIKYGYLDGTADGIFGNKTEEAVIAFNTIHETLGGAWATSAMQELLYNGDPSPYTPDAIKDPDMTLFINGDKALKTTYNNGSWEIRFPVFNSAERKTVIAFELCVYIEDIWGNKIWGQPNDYQYNVKTCTIHQSISPKQETYSYARSLPNEKELYKIHCAIQKIAYDDGTTYTVPGIHMRFYSWTVQ